MIRKFLVPASIVIAFFLHSRAEAHVIKWQLHSWQGSMSELLKRGDWKRARVSKDDQGKSWLLLTRKPYPECPSAEIAACDAAAESNPAARAEEIGCFIPQQFDICGIGVRTGF